MTIRTLSFLLCLLPAVPCFCQETLQTVTTAGSTTTQRVTINNAIQQGVIATPSDASSSNYLAQYAYTTINGATNNIASYALLRTQAAYWFNGPSGLGFYNKGAYSRPTMEVVNGNYGNFSNYLPANCAIRNNFLYQFIACLTNYTSDENLITDASSEVLYGIYKNRKFYINKGLMIGTTTSDAGSLLQVNGNITAKKLTITQTGWPDYVFDSTYQLRQLPDLETYLKKNRHLPGIPSSEEITSKGMDVAAILTGQMEKIEELTVYLISQNKTIQNQQKEIDRLSALVESLLKKENKKE